MALDQTPSSDFFPPETKKFLEELRSKNILLGLVTSSEKCLTERLLIKTDIKSLFHIILTREDTPENKPHPMPYLTAMEKLNLSPNKTFIFEDSPSGIKAAIDSGAYTFQAGWLSKVLK